ncbi:MAG: hypothetical protein J0M11_11685 [Anaerolineae bacterium]|nr:hypothetical protein [Anaerolineae bacterium]
MKASTILKGLVLVLLIGVGLGYGVGVGIKSLQFNGWKVLKAPGSPHVSYGASAYNKNSSYALMFGGIEVTYNDSGKQQTWSANTWKWDGKKWEQLVLQNSPIAREKHAMAYDENRDEIVLFGGSSNGNVYNDTWIWTGETWVEKKPEHVPSIRCCHAMAYDPIRKGVILYGGWNGKQLFYDETWLWDGEDWTMLDYFSPYMSGHTLVQNPQKETIISIQTSHQGTWELTSDGWLDLALPSPPSRSDGRADFGDDRIVLFGGGQNLTQLNDTWVFQDNTWLQLFLHDRPSARAGHILFYDQVRESFIVFGGSNETGILGDTWELKLPKDISKIAFPATVTP